MIDGSYLVEVDTPLGRKSATVDFETNGNELKVSVDAPIIGKRSGKGTVEGNSFSATGSTKIPLKGTIEFTVQGEVNDGILVGEIKSNFGDFAMIGAQK